MSRLSTSTSSTVISGSTIPRTTAAAVGSIGGRADTTHGHPLSSQLKALLDTVNGNTVTLGNNLIEQRRMMDAISTPIIFH